MIAIKNMKNIPNRCIECELKSGGYCYHKNPPYNLSESDMLKEKPTDCPWVEIITCKNCKHCYHMTDAPKVLVCEKHNCQQVSKNFFCADGERRE